MFFHSVVFSKTVLIKKILRKHTFGYMNIIYVMIHDVCTNKIDKDKRTRYFSLKCRFYAGLFV